MFVVMLVVIAILLFLLLQGGVVKIFPPPTPTKTTGTTSVPPLPIRVTVYPTAAGFFERFNANTTRPVDISFTAGPVGTSPFTYLWDFGDGASSTSLTPSHVFSNGCGYDVKLKVTDSLGHVSSWTMLLNVFLARGIAGTMVVCPQRGTAGITQVALAGGYYGSNESLKPLVDSKQVAATFKADNGGSWALSVTGDLGPKVNGSLYTITTSPSSVRGTFLTLEGIRATPASGEPGDPFTLEGRSYPANTTVSIYLGGVSLGQAQSDGNGTFLASLQVPSSLHYAGTYRFTTYPPVLGASATFKIPVSTATPAQPGPNLWWLVILAAVVVAAVLVVLYLRRRRKRKAAAGEPEAGKGQEGEPEGGRRRRQVSLRGAGLLSRPS